MAPMRVLLGAAALAASLSAAAGSVGQLYALTDPLQLQTISPKTGALHATGGQPVMSEGMCEQLSAFYRAKGIFYSLGWNATSAKANLIGLNMDGFVHSNVDLALQESAFVGVGQAVGVDEATGEVLVVGRPATEPTLHVLYRANPATGALTKIAPVGDAKTIDMLGASAAFDGTRLWVQYAENTTATAILRAAAARGGANFDALSGLKDVGRAAHVRRGAANGIVMKLWGIDATTGKVTSVPLDAQAGHALSTVAWDAGKKLLAGTGIRPASDGNGIIRTVVTLDPNASPMKWTVNDLDGYLMQGGGVNTIDEEHGTLYALLQKVGANATDPWFLVGAAGDGSLVSSAQIKAAAGAPGWPWSLQYSN